MMSTSEPQAIALLHQFNILHSLSLIIVGLWFHEFVAHLAYDWKLLNRSDAGRPTVARLAKWTYLTSRTLPLIYGICVIIFALPGKPDCQVLIKVLTASGSFGIVCASALLSVRVAAVWAWNKRMNSFLIVVAMVLLAFAIYFTAEVTSMFDPAIQSCAMNGVHSDLFPSMATLVGDCIIVALLLTGLQRNWREARQLRMWHILWTQGLLYLLIAIAVEVPVVVTLVMNVNPIMNTMFITPEVMLLAICATRMFRFLNTAVRGRGEESEMFTVGVSQGRGVNELRNNGVQLVPLRRGNTPYE